MALNEKQLEEISQLESQKREIQHRISEIKASEKLDFANSGLVKLSWCSDITEALRNLIISMLKVTNGGTHYSTVSGKKKKVSELNTEEINIANNFLRDISETVNKYIKIIAYHNSIF